MKKLMFVAAAALCGSLFAAGEITSANVVGYANNPTVSGNKAAGANFVGVAALPGAGHLTDLRVGGYTVEEDFEDGAFVGQVVASKLNEFGSTVKDKDGNAISWTWGDWFEDEDTRVYGWMDGEGAWIGKDVEDVPLALGEGLWLASDNAKWKLVSSGEVYGETTPCQLVVGNRFCVNPCPKALTLTQCIVGGYSYPEDFEDDAFVGQVVASKLNEFGSTVKDKSGNAISWTWGDWFEESVEVSGWMDGEGLWIGTDVDDVPVAMGEGLWVASDSAKWQFVFPKSIETVE